MADTLPGQATQRRGAKPAQGVALASRSKVLKSGADRVVPRRGDSHAAVAQTQVDWPASASATGAAGASDEADDSQSRHDMIALAAYYRAERRGFGEGQADTDWLEAEREVDGTARSQAPGPLS